MKFILRPISFLSVALIMLSSCDKDDDNNNNNNLNAQDDNFLKKAAYANRAEVEFGVLALSKSSNDSVRMFAQMMVSDHSVGLSGVDSLGNEYNVDLPDTIDSLHQVLKAQLSGFSSVQFDTAYIHGQIKDHITTINLYQTEAGNGQQQNIKNFAGRTLPELNEHLAFANEVSATLP